MPGLVVGQYHCRWTDAGALEAGDLVWQADGTAGVRRAVHEVTKYYAFNGQRIARRQDGVLTYLHTDHLGSTLLATNSSGTMVGEHRYRAYGSSRGGDELATDHRFTGQKYDDTGLYYDNARYYDPEIGAFIGCPLGADTLVPDPTNLLDYNRYSYVRGRPLNMNDPSGHQGVDVGPYLDPGSNCWHWCGVATLNPQPHPMAGPPDLPTLEQVHTALDAVGMVDPTGIADGANALIYITKGEHANAVLSAAALIPLGDVLKAGKYADEAAEIAGGNADEVVYGERVLKRMADNPDDLGHNFPTLFDADIL